MLGHKRMPSREGGVEIVVEELSVRMAALGHEVTVYNRKGKHVSGVSENGKDRSNKFEYKGVKVKTVWTLPNKSLNAIVYSFFATVRAVFSNAEVIHFHAEGPCAMLPIAKLSGKRCVATIHGLDWKRAKWGGFATRFLLFGEKMAAKYADEIIVLSKGVQKYFLDTYGRKTVVIPNGIYDSKIIDADIIAKKYDLHGQDYLLFLARLVPEKGVHILLNAYHKSALTIPLLIAGGSSHSGEYCRQIESMAARINTLAEQKGTGQKVIMTGFVQGKELEELYSNALLYILPSEIEGMPLSLLEAMSYGNLCLTSDIPENTDVTEDYGFSFGAGSEELLAAKLTSVYKDISTIRGMEKYKRENIRNFILAKYNWDDVTKRTLKCYENIDGK